MSLVEDVRLHATLLSPLPNASDPIQRLHSQAELIVHSKICDVAPGSRLAEEAWRCATYAKGLLTIHSNTLKEFNER